MSTNAKVFIIGAGPGDPDLLTMKAHRLIQQAEVIVYDRLVSQEILALAPGHAEMIAVGKETGHHCVPQERINELLAELANTGKRTVRLKGGDPFVFGRGSEEALHLVQEGISFEIVPGITAAAACTAYSGIPLTHRGLSRSVRFLTGHLRNDGSLDLDWDRIADPECTLVIYMGLATLDEVAKRLLEAGLPVDMPAAAIENGTTAQQRCLISRLETLPQDVKTAEMKAPVLIVIGQVVTLSKELGHWFPHAQLADTTSTATLVSA